jgi:hypothetical protein
MLSFTAPVITESSRYSYRVQAADVGVAATATDVLVLYGSSTRTIRVNRIQATADATAQSVIDFYVYKRTALDTGGTSTVLNIAKNDSLDPDSTATVRLYSANPAALGSGILFAGDHYALPAAASTGYPGVPWVEDFGVRNDKSLILRGPNECVAFSLDGQTIPAGFVLYAGMSWTEM